MPHTIILLLSYIHLRYLESRPGVNSIEGHWKEHGWIRVGILRFLPLLGFLFLYRMLFHCFLVLPLFV